MNTSTYDSNCKTNSTTTFNYLDGVLTSQSVQTNVVCDDPLKTQTGGFISFVEIAALVAFGTWFLLYHGKFNQKEIS